MNTARKSYAKRQDSTRTADARATSLARRAVRAERYEVKPLNVEALATELHSLPVGVAR